jgi:hypothetical protein
VAAAITLRDHAAEALLEVDMPQGDMPGVDTPAVDMVDMHGVAMLGLEWGRLELDGTALTGRAIGTVAAIGTAPTMVVIGTVAITGMAIIGVATTGTAIIGIMGIIIMAMMWSSSAALAFRIGGGGGLRGAGTTAIHTAIILMAMVAPTGTVTAVTPMVMATGIIMDTATVMAMEVMAMEATDTAPSTSLATETAANPESPSCNSGCHGLAITVDPSTESWGRKRGAQSGRTSKTTITQVNRRHSGHADRSRACNNLSVDWPAVS